MRRDATSATLDGPVPPEQVVQLEPERITAIQRDGYIELKKTRQVVRVDTVVEVVVEHAAGVTMDQVVKSLKSRGWR